MKITSYRNHYLACSLVSLLLSGSSVFAQDSAHIQDPRLTPTTPSDPSNTRGIASPGVPLSGTHKPDDRIPSSDNSALKSQPNPTTPSTMKNKNHMNNSLCNDASKSSTHQVMDKKCNPADKKTMHHSKNLDDKQTRASNTPSDQK